MSWDCTVLAELRLGAVIPKGSWLSLFCFLGLKVEHRGVL